MRITLLFFVLIALFFNVYYKSIQVEVKSVDKDMAEKLVTDSLSSKDNPYNIRVISSETTEHSDHFKVRALPEKQIETGDFKYMIPGLGMFIVDKLTGTVKNQGSNPNYESWKNITDKKNK